MTVQSPDNAVASTAAIVRTSFTQTIALKQEGCWVPDGGSPPAAKAVPYLIESVEQEIVIPAQAGIHILRTLEFMDSRLRGNDVSEN